MSNETVPMIHAPTASGSNPQQMLPLRGIQNDSDGNSAILQALLMAFDNSNAQTRLRVVADGFDDVSGSTTPLWLGVLSRLTGFDGTDFDRLRTLLDSTNGQATGVKGLLGVVSRLQAFNGTTFDRVRTLIDSADAQASGVVGLLGTIARLQAYNGATFDRVTSLSAANLSAFSGLGGLIAAPPGEWAIEHRPAAATAATITRAAGAAGVRHVCKSITASIVATAAQGQIDVLLRDGATGAGTVLWSARLAAAAGTGQTVVLNGLNIVGSAATAMTLEFAAAPAATNFAGVALSGTDAS